jgi:pimeloyl-ACP methyl ester carboxylesterase
MATFVLAHGAWSAAWAWRRLRPLMQASGHAFYAPTYTGLGERRHLVHEGLDLEAHIADVRAVIETEELSDITLLGHSYGGMVATGVADRVGDRISSLVYLDAFVPRDGQSVFDLLPVAAREGMEAATARDGDGWQLPPNPPPPDTSEDDQTWIARHRCNMPVGCFRQKLKLGAEPSCPRHYIYALKTSPGDPFGQFAERARSEAGWTLHELDVSHSPNITAPDLLMQTLNGIVA